MKTYLTFLAATAVSLPLIAKDAPSQLANNDWQYQGDKGPEAWGDLSENYGTCKTGKQQSPINITGSFQDMSDVLILNYSSTPLNAYKLLEKVRQDIAPGNHVSLNGERYNLLQFHTHAPSEHQINGKTYDGVMHFVHKNAKGELLVIGVMLEASDTANAQWEDILNHMESGKKGDLNLDGLFTNAARYFHYSGSLTTPPCSENVKWFVMETPLKVSKAQMDRIRSQHTHTNRPIQALNARKIYAVG